jgi:hypothetical protein
VTGTTAALIAHAAGGAFAAQAAPDRSIRDRGYYFLPMRAPTFGLDVWKELVDDLATDGVTHFVYWCGGSFRSRKFPITWEWNADHANVRSDFTRELIAHAHTRGLKVLLGFTPFGYDGVNQYPLVHPELKARKADGSAVDRFGIACWGWNLCPAQPEPRRFMREYVREMAFEFYPDADGLFIESSDYAICHCPRCGPRFFDHEYAFVHEMAEAIWARRPQDTVVVYPHYFSGAKLRFALDEARATRQPFDPRYTLFFTPHSAAIEPDLVRQARGSWWWNEAPCRLDLHGIRAGVKRVIESGLTGYLPTFEAMSFVATDVESGIPWTRGRRQVPFGFGWVPEGASPYRTLPMRAVRLAFSELTRDPDLAESTLRQRMGRDLFGPEWTDVQLDDLASVLAMFGSDRDWAKPAPIAAPGMVEAEIQAGRFDATKRATVRQQLSNAGAIAARHRNATEPGAQELARIAEWVIAQWPPARAQRLEP